MNIFNDCNGKKSLAAAGAFKKLSDVVESRVKGSRHLVKVVAASGNLKHSGKLQNIDNWYQLVKNQYNNITGTMGPCLYAADSQSKWEASQGTQLFVTVIAATLVGFTLSSLDPMHTSAYASTTSTIARGTGHRPADQTLQTAGALDDSLISLDKKLNAFVDSTIDQAASIIPKTTDSQYQKKAQDVIKEVQELVSDFYLDARNQGFDKQKWVRIAEKASQRQITDQWALDRAIREMIAAGIGDPYTRYLSPSEFQKMTAYDVSGVGLNLGTASEFRSKVTNGKLPPGTEQDGVFVVGLMSNGEAAANGIQQGDQILAVADKEVGTMLAPFQVESLIRGTTPQSGDQPNPSGQQSVLVHVRNVGGDVNTVTLKRTLSDPMPSPVETYTRIENAQKVGYIRLRSFNARAQTDVRKSIKELQSQQVDSFVLDLRSNRGGAVREGVEVAKLFLEPGSPVLKIKDRSGETETFAQNSNGAVTDLPLVVLVNQNTASAAEILAGAVRDNCRAPLVGSQTFGKGLVQSVYQLQNGSGIVLTNAKYFTPKGTDLDKTGLIPDFGGMPSRSDAAKAMNICKTNNK